MNAMPKLKLMPIELGCLESKLGLLEDIYAELKRHVYEDDIHGMDVGVDIDDINKIMKAEICFIKEKIVLLEEELIIHQDEEEGIYNEQ